MCLLFSISFTFHTLRSSLTDEGSETLNNQCVQAERPLLRVQERVQLLTQCLNTAVSLCQKPFVPCQLPIATDCRLTTAFQMPQGFVAACPR